MDESDDPFDSVHWQRDDQETRDVPATTSLETRAESSTSQARPTLDRQRTKSEWPEGAFLKAEVRDPVKELEGTKDTYISYAIVGSTNLPMFASKSFTVRRRFHDFVFLHDHLAKDFPACVVPPLPDKHRLEYVTGDRFSTDFVEHRRKDLQRFLTRLCHHSTLARSSLLQAFLESTEWNVRMHQQLAHPPVPELPPSLLDNLSDTLLNAFSKVRKPDPRFVDIKDNLEKFEDALGGVERVENRLRTRIGDLSSDYEDFAASIQGLGYLESGITEPLSKFESALLDFSEALKLMGSTSTEPFLYQLHSMQAYSAAFKSVLKLRDQKQLDFEELSAYLSSVTTEHDRLQSGMPGGLGLASYIKSRVDTIRGTDIGRESRAVKLQGKIKELQEAVTQAHETSDDFNQEVVREHEIFRTAKRIEMVELLNDLADGNIALHKASIEAFERCEPALTRIAIK